MRRPEFDLSSIYSNGPRVVEVNGLPPEVRDSPCRRCSEGITKGARICKVRGGWQHRKCAVETLADMPASEAWLALAMDAAKRPRAYRADTLRQILNSVVGLVLGAEVEEHAAYVEALAFAYEKRVADGLGERIGTLDPHRFARRWAEFDWSADDEWDEERLPLEKAYELAWAEDIRDMKEAHSG